MTLFVVYSFSLSTAAGVFLPSVRESLGLSDVVATYVLQAFVIAYALMQIPAGYFIDNLRARWVVSIGVCLLAIGALLQSMSSTIGFFVAANFIQGIGGAFSFIAAGALIGQWFPIKQFPIWFGLTQAVSCILTGVIHSIFTNLIEVHSWNAIYRVLAFIGFALAVLCFVFVRNPKTYAPVKQSFLKPLATVLKNRQVWLFSAIGLTSFGVMLAYANVWLIEVQKYHAVSMLNSVRVSAYLFAGIGIGHPVSGLVVECGQNPQRCFAHIPMYRNDLHAGRPLSATLCDSHARHSKHDIFWNRIFSFGVDADLYLCQRNYFRFVAGNGYRSHQYVCICRLHSDLLLALYDGDIQSVLHQTLGHTYAVDHLNCIGLFCQRNLRFQ